MLRYKKNQKFLCFDFETCNLNLLSDENKPWQLSFIVAEGNKVIQEFDIFIFWEDLNISEEAARITNFNHSKYIASASNPSDALYFFEQFLYDEDYLIVGQNILGFDVYIHNILRRLVGKKPDYSYLNRIIDTQCLAKAIKKNLQPPKDEELIFWQYKLNSIREKNLKTSLKSQLKDHEIDFDESKLHDSLYDVRMTFQVFCKQIWKLDI